MLGKSKKKDSIVIGIIAGTIIPFVGYAIFLMIFEGMESGGVASDEGMSSNFRARTTALVAIALNLIPLIYFNKNYLINSMRGIVFPTLVYVIIWFVVYGRHLVG